MFVKIAKSYHVVELQGAQYLVRAGDIIQTNRIDLEADKTLKADRVLLSVNDDKVILGTPYIKDSFVDTTIVKHFLGPKVTVAKFKAKTGYRRKNGYRPSLSLVKINSLH